MNNYKLMGAHKELLMKICNRIIAIPAILSIPVWIVIMSMNEKVMEALLYKTVLISFYPIFWPAYYFPLMPVLATCTWCVCVSLGIGVFTIIEHGISVSLNMNKSDSNEVEDRKINATDKNDRSLMRSKGIKSSIASLVKPMNRESQEKYTPLPRDRRSGSSRRLNDGI